MMASVPRLTGFNSCRNAAFQGADRARRAHWAIMSDLRALWMASCSGFCPAMIIMATSLRLGRHGADRSCRQMLRCARSRPAWVAVTWAVAALGRRASGFGQGAGHLAL